MVYGGVKNTCGNGQFCIDIPVADTIAAFNNSGNKEAAEKVEAEICKSAEEFLK